MLIQCYFCHHAEQMLGQLNRFLLEAINTYFPSAYLRGRNIHTGNNFQIINIDQEYERISDMKTVDEIVKHFEELIGAKLTPPLRYLCEDIYKADNDGYEIFYNSLLFLEQSHDLNDLMYKMWHNMSKNKITVRNTPMIGNVRLPDNNTTNGYDYMLRLSLFNKESSRTIIHNANCYLIYNESDSPQVILYRDDHLLYQCIVKHYENTFYAVEAIHDSDIMKFKLHIITEYPLRISRD